MLRNMRSLILRNMRSFEEKNMITYAPISCALSDDGSGVKVEILQREVAFDIVCEVFVFLSTEKLKISLKAKDIDVMASLFYPYLHLNIGT